MAPDLRHLASLASPALGIRWQDAWQHQSVLALWAFQTLYLSQEMHTLNPKNLNHCQFALPSNPLTFCLQQCPGHDSGLLISSMHHLIVLTLPLSLPTCLGLNKCLFGLLGLLPGHLISTLPGCCLSLSLLCLLGNLTCHPFLLDPPPLGQFPTSAMLLCLLNHSLQVILVS